MTAVTVQEQDTGTALASANIVQFVTVNVGDQSFGIPVLDVEDIIGPQPVTIVPQAIDVVSGSLNLRGRIVTAVNLRRRLGMPQSDTGHHMNVVVEHKGDLYSLVVDSVGEVLNIGAAAIEPHPATMSASLREVSRGIHKLEGELLVLLDVNEVLSF